MADNNDSYFEKEEQAQAQAQQDMIEERRDVAQDENVEPVRILSADEIRETAETQGFNF